jgi:hypothetical protein
MGLYYSLPEWNHPLHRWYTDSDRNIKTYVDQHMIPQFKELISIYKPTVLFADGEWNNSAKEWHSAELIDWYYNLVGDEAIVNNRWGGGSNIGFLTPEYSSGIKVTDRPWAEVRGLGRSFGLNRNENLEAYMSSKELVHFFARAVSHGGGIIINVGPGSDGQIPLLQQERLIDLGKWLEINGEAIYGSEVWDKPGEEREVKLEKIDPDIAFNWVRNTPGKPIKEDEFQAKWRGFIKPHFSEEYTFEALVDDGMKVWIDGDLVINKWSGQNSNADGDVMGNVSFNVTRGSKVLEAGHLYSIKVEFFEKSQNARAELFWESYSQQKETIPGANYFVDSEQKLKGLQATYTSKQQHIAFTQNRGNIYAIVLAWPDGDLILNINRPGKDATIELLGRIGNIPWKYKKNQLIIETSSIKYNEIPGNLAWTFRITNPNL